jgi:type III restriction enzyme
MNTRFFEHPILNSPYEYPSSHWELDKDGQPTNQLIESRRRAEFITPIPKAKKRKRNAAEQQELGIGGGAAIFAEKRTYEPAPRNNELRARPTWWA